MLGLERMMFRRTLFLFLFLFLFLGKAEGVIFSLYNSLPAMWNGSGNL